MKNVHIIFNSGETLDIQCLSFSMVSHDDTHELAGYAFDFENPDGMIVYLKMPDVSGIYVTPME